LRRISVGWLLILVLVWWILAGGGAAVWAAGALAVGLGLVLHTGLGGPGTGRVSLLGALVFLPFFLRESFRGGVDVARRAFSPSLPLAPRFLSYRLRLPEGRAQVFFVNCLSLLPGTFSAEFREGRLRVHLLAGDGAHALRLDRLERKVAGLFGVALPPGEDEGPRP
jgi:multicomponent Na+:H+ antiporter subunit E